MVELQTEHAISGAMVALSRILDDPDCEDGPTRRLVLTAYTYLESTLDK